MLIKVKNKQNLFLKEEKIICSINSIEQINNDVFYQYKIYIPIDVTLSKKLKASHISTYLSNRDITSLKLQPKIGTSIFEKKFDSVKSKITRTSESRFFKLGQLSKEAIANKNNILFKNKTAIFELIKSIDSNSTYKKYTKESYSNITNVPAPAAPDNLVDKQYFISKKVTNSIKNNMLTLKKESRISQSINVTDNKKTSAFIPITLNFKESDINKINADRENLNFVFLMKKKSNLQIDSTSFSINHSQKTYDFKKRKLIQSFNVSSHKNIIRASMQNPFNLNVNFVLYVKNFNRLGISNSTFSKIATINSNGSDSASIDLFKIKNKNLENRGTNYFRVLIEIDGIAYHDFKKEIVIKNKHHKSLQEVITCFSSLDTGQGNNQSGGNSIQTVFYNLPVDSHSVEIFKRRRHKSSKTKFVSKGVFLTPDIIDNRFAYKDFAYVDKDIEDGFEYDYKIKLFFNCRDPIMINKISSFQYDEPKEIVEINKIGQTAKSIEFKVSFKVNDIETLFKNLLRNDFELYKDQLKDISSLNGTIIKVKVKKYSLIDGSYKNAGIYSLNSENIFKVPINLVEEKNHIIVLYPQITTVSQEISNVKKTLLNSDIANTSQNIFARNVLTQKRVQSKEISFSGAKFSSENFIKRGLISSKNKLNNIEPTGDIRYFDILKKSSNIPANLNYSIEKKYDIASSKIFFKSQNLRYKHSVEINFQGDFVKSADKIVFYYLDDDIEIPVGLGHIDHLSTINKYSIEYSSLYKDDIMTYILYDSFDQAIDYQIL